MLGILYLFLANRTFACILSLSTLQNKCIRSMKFSCNIEYMQKSIYHIFLTLSCAIYYWTSYPTQELEILLKLLKTVCVFLPAPPTTSLDFFGNVPNVFTFKIVKIEIYSYLLRLLEISEILRTHLRDSSLSC